MMQNQSLSYESWIDGYNNVEIDQHNNVRLMQSKQELSFSSGWDVNKKKKKKSGNDVSLSCFDTIKEQW